MTSRFDSADALSSPRRDSTTGFIRSRIYLALTIAVLVVAASGRNLHGQQSCPCSVWTPVTTPGPVAIDASAVELGMKFQSDTAGFVTGVRFYKYSQNTGTHIGSLWTAAGVNLGTVVFGSETASGWQQASFPTPVAISTNTTYVISYHTNTGFYAAAASGFASQIDNAPLHALSNGASGGNGVYVYSANTAFPSQAFNATNYSVDVVFAASLGPDVTPPTVTSSTPVSGASGVSTTASVSAMFSETIDATTINGTTVQLRDAGSNLVASTVAYNAATQTATLTPSAPLANSSAYTATIKSGAGGVKDIAGNALASDYLFSFTTAAAVSCPCSVWTTSTAPGPLVAEAAALELGMKFQSDVSGTVSGVRFYKYAQNSGTHVGSLWTAGGTQLATVTFNNETASGWQQAAFSPPVAINANTTYVISYHTNTGFYADTQSGFSSAVNTAPLHALADAVAPGNGLYAYTANTAFPNQTWNGSNYWVDVVLTTAVADTTAPTVAMTAPAGGATVSGTTVAVTATASDNVGVAGVQFTLDGVTLGAEDTTSPYSVTWNSTTATNASHTLTAVARDAAGNTTTSTGVIVTVSNDTTPPTVAITAPAGGATVSGTTVAVTATASDNVGVAGVQFKLDGVSLGAEDTTPSYAVTWDSTTATNGSHILTAVARDAAGNTTTSPGVTVTVSNGGGMLSIDAVAFKDVPFSASSMTTSAFTTTAGSELLLAFVTAADTSTSNSATSVTGGSLTWQLVLRTNTQPGTSEVWRAFSTNVLTNATVTATLAHQAAGSLTVVTFKGADPSGTNGSGAIGATTSASAVSGASSATVMTTRNNSWVFGSGNDWDQALARTMGANQTMVHQFLSSVGDTFWVQRSTNLTPVLGTNVTINDTAPGNGRYNFSVLEVLPTTDIAAPTLAVTSPANNAIVSGTAVTLSATASDNVAVVGVQFKLDGLNIGAEDTASPYTTIWNTTTATSGVHTLSAVARDTSGNLTTVALTITVDNTAPVVAIASPAAGSTVASTVTITATATDNIGVAGVQFKLDGANIGTEIVSAPYNLVWDATAAVDGTHVLSAVARDAAGNSTTSATVSVTVNNPPTVIGTSPSPGGTNVATNSALTVMFRESMDPTTVSAATITLRDPSNNVISATVTYAPASMMATLLPGVRLANNTVYTATVSGGGAGVKDLTGLAMTGDVTWTFTTGVIGCPCSVWEPWTVAGPMNVDPSSVELGLQFKSDVSGFITGVRFFKYPENSGAHVGNLWTTSGTLLATVGFTNESASGWQQAAFPSAVPVTAGTTYVISYFTPVGYYATTLGGLTNPVDNPPLHALSNQQGGGNGLYRYTTASAYPNQTFGSANYWVDAVFTTSAADALAPMVTAVSPASGTVGVGVTSVITATFNEAMNPATVTTSTVTLRTSTNTVVPATVSYNPTTLTATLTPTSALSTAASYTATLTSGIKDLSGNALSGGSWSFDTAAAQASPTQGTGGPILVVTSSSDPFSQYYFEILRAEGLNEFGTLDISQVTASALASYDVAILSAQTLTAAQVTTLTTWVQGGGNLIAIRPDSKLAPLLGITSAGATTSSQYLLIDTTKAPGTGLVNQSIQFHSPADAYLLAEAATVATLYSDANTATAYPAVTITSVGANGGHAAAFTYDLARSVVYSRQGNPAWAGMERDGLTPIRTDDLFFGEKSGDLQPDWVDLNKVAIPQADEQQRLLANLIELMNNSRRPLPRLWYLPFGKKAAVVMTGDDHNSGGTPGRFDHYMALSPAGCVVENWECVRSTSNVYPGTPITDSKVASLVAEGFELALHVTMDPLTQFGCGLNFTPATLASVYTTQLALFNAKWPSAGGSVTNRMHCLTWSDWSTQASTELANNIRLDTSYYYWPGNWAVNPSVVGDPLGAPGPANRPGFMNASGFPMRFASSTGQMINVYQAATQMTDESGQVYPGFAVSLLDNAVGASGYYGVFTVNMHEDDLVNAVSAQADAIISAAQTRGVPVVSAKQMLNWLDGRNSSAFGSIAWSGSALTFTVIAGPNTNGMQVMVPAVAGAQHLVSLTLNGLPVVYSVQTIKGIQYAFVSTGAGTYRATFAP